MVVPSLCLPHYLIMQFVLRVQGSVVVFGNYGEWTFNEDEIGVEGKEFCEYTPFMFAFVLLIIKWVRSEIIILLV